MKVCWLTSYCSPYKLKLLDEVGKSCDLTVLVLADNDENRNSEWGLKEEYHFEVIKITRNFYKDIKKLAKENDILIDGMYASIQGVEALFQFKKNHKKTVLIADGGIAVDRGFIVNKAISFLMKMHDYVFSSSVITNKYFKYYGFDENKIKLYKFTSLTKENIEDNKEYSLNKQELRKELNIPNKFTLLSIGQPIDRKGFDILLEAYNKTNLKDEINIYIVGGDPQEKIKKYKEDNKLDNVHFVGLLSSKDLRKYYAVSDTFILCTREDIWGLVIQEAMSYGLPIITSDNCVCGLHFNKLNEDIKICGVNDIEAYASTILDLYNTNDLQTYKKVSLDLVKEYTIENSSKELLKNIEEVLN